MLKCMGHIALRHVRKEFSMKTYTQFEYSLEAPHLALLMSADKTAHVVWMINYRLLNVYRKILGTSSYGEDA